MAHTAVVCSSKKLRLPPSQQSPASSAHGAAGADDALVVLIKLRWPDASPRCQPADCLSVGARGGVVWARPHDQDQLCRVRTRSLVGVWVGVSVGVSVFVMVGLTVGVIVFVTDGVFVNVFVGV